MRLDGDDIDVAVRDFPGKADQTCDRSVGLASIAAIWTLWRRRPERILVPGTTFP